MVESLFAHLNMLSVRGYDLLRGRCEEVWWLLVVWRMLSVVWMLYMLYVVCAVRVVLCGSILVGVCR